MTEEEQTMIHGEPIRVQRGERRERNLLHRLYHRLWLSRFTHFRLIDEYTASASTPHCFWCARLPDLGVPIAMIDVDV